MTITDPGTRIAAAVPTCPDFEARIRGALGDAAQWDRLIADSALHAQIEQWLVDRITLIETQLARHQAEFTKYTTTEYRRDFKVRLAEYQEWRAKAVNFRGMCVRRLTALRRLEQRTTHDEATELIGALTDVLQELACAVLEFERGEIDAGELFRALDEITVPAARPPFLTAREHAVLYERTCDLNPPTPTTDQPSDDPTTE